MKETSTPIERIKRRMKRIAPHSRAFFIKNPNNIRFCHVENESLNYLVFPFCSKDMMITAAQLLVDCGIVDSYKEIAIDEHHFYVDLIEYKYYEHTDARGRRLGVNVPRVKQWCDIKMTIPDVQHFIARFQLAPPEIPKETTKHAA